MEAEVCTALRVYGQGKKQAMPHSGQRSRSQEYLGLKYLEYWTTHAPYTQARTRASRWSKRVSPLPDRGKGPQLPHRA